MVKPHVKYVSMAFRLYKREFVKITYAISIQMPVSCIEAFSTLL